MSGNCDQNCSSCGEDCPSRKTPHIEKEALNPASTVRKVVAVVSGKGGVGKSLVSGLLAVSLARAGKKTAVLDADITGPSVPKMFGAASRVYEENGLLKPVASSSGIELMSLNLLLIAAGIVTTVPLLCFTAAATRLRLSTLGFFQYIGPTLMFLLAVTFYGEKPGADKMVTFAFIWVALAIFVMDAIYTQRRTSK